MTAPVAKSAGPNPPADCKTYASEEQLEHAIAAAMARMCAAPDRTLKMQYWREMCALIDQRTPGRRRFMARVRDLP